MVWLRERERRKGVAFIAGGSGLTAGKNKSAVKWGERGERERETVIQRSHVQEGISLAPKMGG